MKETKFAEKVEAAGGHAYIVGGWVRDKILGRESHDKDYAVSGLTQEKFMEIFPKAEQVGKLFPVYIMMINDELCEVAFARREKKIGDGHNGFEVEFIANTMIMDDLMRRDFTCNAMAINLADNKLIADINAIRDTKQKVLRVVSEEHFAEDPLRALRAARFAATMDFDIAKDTYTQMEKCKVEELSYERIWGEMVRALGAHKPSTFFRSLRTAGMLDRVFPEIYDLIDKAQVSEGHPEGDAFEHTMDVLDRVAANTTDVVARFCALAHDLGKGRTPADILPHHYGHEHTGVKVLNDWNNRMGGVIPNDFLKPARFVCKNHMKPFDIRKPGKIVTLLLSCDKIHVMNIFRTVVEADNNNRMELPVWLVNGGYLVNKIKKVSGVNHPPHMKGKDIGEWMTFQRVCRFQEEMEKLWGHTSKQGVSVLLNKDSKYTDFTLKNIVNTVENKLKASNDAVILSAMKSLDYFVATSGSKDQMKDVPDCDELFEAVAKTEWGGSEGIYTDVSIYLKNRNGNMDMTQIIIIKTLAESEQAFLNMHYLQGAVLLELQNISKMMYHIKVTKERAAKEAASEWK